MTARLSPEGSWLEGPAGDPYADGGLPPAFRAARLERLRALLDRETREVPAETARGYAAAVAAYLREASAVAFADAEALVASPLLTLSRQGRPPKEAAGAVVRGPVTGAIYASLPALLEARAAPRAVEAVEVRPQFVGEDGGGRPLILGFAAFREKTAAVFRWPAEDFPVLSVRLEKGALLIPVAVAARAPAAPPPLEWREVAAGAAPEEAWVRAACPLVRRTSNAGGLSPTRPMACPSKNELRSTGGDRGEEASAKKGARGEARVAAALKAHTDYLVQSTAHRARSADLVLDTPAGPVYVDSKDYKTAVPEKEVAKFRRDLGARGAAAGLLVSLSSKITGRAGALSAALEALPGQGRAAPVVYAASGSPEVIAAGAQLAVHLALQQRAGAPLDSLAAPSGAFDLHACARGLEEVADRFEAARHAQSQGLAAFAAKSAGATEDAGYALRDLRRAICAQKEAALGPAEEPATLDGLWGLFEAKFELCRAASPWEGKAALRAVLGALSAGKLGPVGGVGRRWRFSKARAAHPASGAAVAFTATRAELVVPVAAAAARLGALAEKHPQKLRVAGGAVALELGDATAPDALELL